MGAWWDGCVLVRKVRWPEIPHCIIQQTNFDMKSIVFHFQIGNVHAEND